MIARFVPILARSLRWWPASAPWNTGALSRLQRDRRHRLGLAAWSLGGYFLGQMIPNIHKHIDKVIVIVIVLSLLPAIIKVVREKMKSSGG